MKQLLSLSLTLIMLLALASCSDSKEFAIEGQVRALGTRPVTLTYITQNTAHTATVTAIDGKFFFTGTARDYALAQVEADNRMLATFVVRNGEHIKCQLDLDNPDDMLITGNKPSQQLSEFMCDNAQLLADQNRPALDSAIVKYVIAHPDRLASTLLLINYYNARTNPALADSLINLIKPEARPAALTADARLQLSDASDATTTAKVVGFTLRTYADSIENFIPQRYKTSLLYFTGDESRYPDSITDVLADLRDRHAKRQLHIAQVSLLNDSTRWRNSLQGADTTRWSNVLPPGGQLFTPFVDLRIPTTPFFIVADDKGKQLYRGQSVSQAAATVNNHLHHLYD